jgi:hypothetical protein
MLEPGSTRHSARVDEQFEDESAATLQNAPGEGVLDADDDAMDRRPVTTADATLASELSDDAVERRSVLAVSLRPSAFPGDRARLLKVAREEDAEERVIAWLEALPEAERFVNVQHVWETLGGGVEHRDAPLAIELPDAPSDLMDAGAHAAPAQIEVSGTAAGEAPESSSSLLARAGGLVIAGAEVAVGIAIEAISALRRRL